MQRIITNKIRCRNCGDIIESKYTHDYVSCSCGNCAVDGGDQYLRRTGEPEDIEELSEVLGDDSDLDELNLARRKNREYYLKSSLHYPIIITMPAFGAEPKTVDVPDFDITVQHDSYSEAIEQARDEVCARLIVLQERNEPFPKPSFIDELKFGRYQTGAFMGIDIDEYRQRKSLRGFQNIISQ